MARKKNKTTYVPDRPCWCPKCGAKRLDHAGAECPDCDSCDPEGSHRFEDFYIDPEKELVFE